MVLPEEWDIGDPEWIAWWLRGSAETSGRRALRVPFALEQIPKPLPALQLDGWMQVRRKNGMRVEGPISFSPSTLIHYRRKILLFTT